MGSPLDRASGIFHAGLCRCRFARHKHLGNDTTARTHYKFFTHRFSSAGSLAYYSAVNSHAPNDAGTLGVLFILL